MTGSYQGRIGAVGGPWMIPVGRNDPDDSGRGGELLQSHQFCYSEQDDGDQAA